MFGLLAPYRLLVAALIVLAFLSNALNLLIPQIIARGIDAFDVGTFDARFTVLEFFIVSSLIFFFTYLQNIVQTFASERVAKDLREEVSAKISRQSVLFIQNATSAKLLTNLTSDTDAVKLFVSQVIPSMLSSIFLIIGSSVLLLLIDWRLALTVLVIIPIIGGTFGFVLSRVRPLFKKTQEIIDRLNGIINESILGAALIRVLNSQQPETEKFVQANADAKEIGLKILRMFASMIPIVTFVANMATLAILLLGGHFVIQGGMTLGEFAAFNSYLLILIFPIFVIGFMSNVLARSSASYARIAEVLQAPDEQDIGTHKAELRGDIDAQNVSLQFGERFALKNVSFSIKAGMRTAIIGPTGAGKTQLLQLLTGLLPPTEGTISYDGTHLAAYDPESLHRQIGLVFQDSVLFNMTLRENIAFGGEVSDEELARAIEAAELRDFIATLPQGLDTVVSERGTSLSGGQKQRIMLARALVLNPKILLLDDFTARVDANTEQRIVEHLTRLYPSVTLLSVTQRIASVEHYDLIILLMEGELLAQGTHQELMRTSPEYVQIAESQKSTQHYELHAH